MLTGVSGLKERTLLNFSIYKNVYNYLIGPAIDFLQSDDRDNRWLQFCLAEGCECEMDM